MHCKLCGKWETKIASCKNFSLSSINSCSNCCLSNVELNFKSMMHLTSVKKEELEEVEKLGSNYKQKITIIVPSNALIKKSIKNMSSIGEEEQDMLKRLI